MNSPIKLPDMSWSLIEALPEDAVTGVFIYAAQAVREALAARDEWMPIETAPKDGREVLLWLGSPWSKVEKARWYAPWKNWQAGVIPADPVREDCYGIGSAVPTHWQPLPTPPKENNHGDTP